jgi:pSer/pThr/pTyr-binding forkhead associated (FHA) protein
VEDATPKLTILTGKLEGKSLPLKGPIVVGRQPGVKLRLSDVKVSREHSKIFEQGGEWFVVDLNSRNGTLVNDAPVTRRALHDGDEITIGETRMRFVLPKPAAPEVEVKTAAPQAEVIDLRKKPEAAPAGAISADMIEVKDRALQFSKKDGRKKPNALFDDLGQRPFFYQLGMFLVVIALSAAFVYAGLLLAGVIGGD